MNSYMKVFSILLAVLLLYLYPIYTAFQQQDDLSELVAMKATTTFVDSVRDKGYISPTMYNDFVEALSVTGLVFDVQIQHESKKYVPVYTDVTRPETFQNRYELHTDNFYQAQIMATLFPEQSVRKDDPLRRYKLRIGDTFAVTVANKSRTPGTVMFDFINNAVSASEKIVIPYGGVVRNEVD
jgi:hypothetical protein